MDLLALTSMAVRPALADLAPLLPPVRFEAAGGVEVARRIRAGASADLAVLAADALAALHAEGLVERPRPLWDSATVAAVPADAPPADLATTADLRTLLTTARAVAHSTGPSGTALRALVDRLGLAARVRLVQAPPGTPAGRLLTDGRADLAFQQHSELADLPGVRVLGPLPGDTALTSTFAAAVLTAAPRPGPARHLLDLLDRLAAAGAPPTARARGMHPHTPAVDRPAG
ncbi:molybdate transport system substrate-binding protein [Kitasatospora sp. SolWspMP-SS2h]|uniref:substrate-binding domain-containing protein n=1 Tax=Kitasatospora sp. SolWspMP-SS2h TaxID=1305729 RepID=UPI000DBF90EE|nr:substrate-binding domain-containing protein [Kitasatospora sp. SolWspMP-SS2h]RAJ46852.1 molybdate transport system substrate-binding protein [Kitasatospora sp. SolWspMP-SS2h]